MGLLTGKITGWRIKQQKSVNAHHPGACTIKFYTTIIDSTLQEGSGFVTNMNTVKGSNLSNCGIRN